ncbi:hypothetical protein TcasGA2_TC002029 [Tribolium castaneum]|uniref:Uncharacterized protein n=1 Tax=Tribolium castaneum TaxID=7070 RepID=D7ELM5_TRICA|nr:hypothetical protein TcasGA2_TC002029 [Tribolium castaneum]
MIKLGQEKDSQQVHPLLRLQRSTSVPLQPSSHTLRTASAHPTTPKLDSQVLPNTGRIHLRIVFCPTLKVGSALFQHGLRTPKYGPASTHYGKADISPTAAHGNRYCVGPRRCTIPDPRPSHLLDRDGVPNPTCQLTMVGDLLRPSLDLSGRLRKDTSSKIDECGIAIRSPIGPLSTIIKNSSQTRLRFLPVQLLHPSVLPSPRRAPAHQCAADILVALIPSSTNPFDREDIPKPAQQLARNILPIASPSRDVTETVFLKPEALPVDPSDKVGDSAPDCPIERKGLGRVFLLRVRLTRRITITQFGEVYLRRLQKPLDQCFVSRISALTFHRFQSPARHARN